MSENHISRRNFVKASAFVGSGMALTGCQATFPGGLGRAELDVPYVLNDPENIVYSVCLQCHTDCPIKVKIFDGVAVKIDGNPYSMQTLNPAIPYATGIGDAARIDSGICPKGQAGLQTLYDPYRIRKVLKRAGKRGEEKWQTIPFDKAIGEIVNGGKLFSHIEGEEDRVVSGLKDLFALRSAELAGTLASDSKAVAVGALSGDDFKRRHRDHLHLLIDPDHPDFGPVNNQFVFQAGRIEHGRKELAKRWMNGGFGSINWFEHTSICEQSHHIAYEMMTNQYVDGSWTKGKDHMKPDLYNATFVVFFGTGAFEANFGPPYMANLVTNRLVSGDLKIAVVDPRLSNTAAKAWRWLPVKPGGDAAVAYAMIRWIIDNEAYDSVFLRNANRAAALVNDESSWSNATWLVKIEDDGPGSLLRASEIGLGGGDSFVAVRNGRPVVVGKAATIGDLHYSGTIRGIRVKTAFQLLSDYARSKSLDEWAEESGLEVQDLVDVSREFARHGKSASAELYRGAVQHTNGYYNAQAIISLNVLAGNIDWKGGLSAGGGHWHEDGSKPGQPFPLAGLHPGKLKAFGHRITREKSHYEQSTLFQEEGYPARRPWFPHTGSVYQEIIPSAADGYPYPIKALFLHKGTPALSCPGAQKVIETLVDTDKIPLLMSCDIVIGETSMYADYIFPDTAIWERWGTPHTTPACPVKQSKIRQPTVESPVETATVFGIEMPVCLESIMLAIAESLDLSGHGKNGFGPGMDLRSPEDFYLKMAANLAAGDKPGSAVPEVSEEDLSLFRRARRHLSPVFFDEEAWNRKATDGSGRNWLPEITYLLNRGGRFEDFDVYRESGEFLPHRFKGLMNLYVEAVAESRHPYTGQRFTGLGTSEPVKGFDNRTVPKSDDFPIRLITYKDIRGGQSRTLPTDYWLTALLPENRIIINEETAALAGIRDGEPVLVVSDNNRDGVWDLKNGKYVKMLGKAKIVQGMRPGVAAVSWHFGHWAYGSQDVEVDGETVVGDRRRQSGLCPNAAMQLDPVLKNVGLEDLIGGSAAYYDSQVNLIPVRSAP
jgi:anaerobic selenocysteine-containing dehydrogenase